LRALGEKGRTVTADSVRRQSPQLFENVETIFKNLEDPLYRKTSGGFPVWRQLYHTVHSIDRYFIDPNAFVEPELHKKNLDSLTDETDAFIERDVLYSYFQKVREKAEEYLVDLTDETLEEIVRFNGIEVTRLELILAQFRHILYHVGYLHCCLKIEAGNAPDYIGLTHPGR